MQIIMLVAHDMGLCSCWIGEILAKSDDVNKLLNVDGTLYELMGISFSDMLMTIQNHVRGKD